MTPGLNLTTRPRLKLLGLIAWHTAVAAACLPAAVVVAAVVAMTPVGVVAVGAIALKRVMQAMKPIMKVNPWVWFSPKMRKLHEQLSTIVYDSKAVWGPLAEPAEFSKSFWSMRLPSGELALADTLEELTEQLHQFDHKPH